MKMLAVTTFAAGALAAAAIAAAPTAAATTVATGLTVHQTPGNAQITAVPDAAAQQAAKLQQPFGGDMGALLFHH
jgi:ABC-type sugar transport system substrate-binding protein